MNLAEKMAKAAARSKKVFGEGSFQQAYQFIEAYQMRSNPPVPFLVFGSAEKETSVGFFPYCLHRIPKILDADPENPGHFFEVLCHRREIPIKNFDKNKNACAVCDLVDSVLGSHLMSDKEEDLNDEDLSFCLEDSEKISDTEQAVNQIVLDMNSMYSIKPTISIIAQGEKVVTELNGKRIVNFNHTPGKVQGFQVGLAPWNARQNRKDGLCVHILSTLQQFRLNDKSFFSLDDSDEDFEFKWVCLQPKGKKGWELVRTDPDEDGVKVDRLDILDLAKKAPNFFEWRTKDNHQKNRNSALFTYEEQVKILKTVECCKQIGAFREFTVERGQANYPPVKAVLDSYRVQDTSA